MTQYLSQKALFEVVVSSLLLGVMLGAIYDVFRIRRRILPIKGRIASAVLVSVEDVIFFAIAGGLASLMFYVVNNGEVRIMGVLGLIPGFVAWRLTFSRLLMAVVDMMVIGLHRLCGALVRRIFAPIGRRIVGMVRIVVGRIDKLQKKRRTKRVTDRAIRSAFRGFDIKIR